MLDRFQPATIIASVHSPRWSSQLRQKIELLDCKPVVQWLLNLQSAVTISETHVDAILIAELPKTFNEKPEESITLISNACNNPQRAPIFILGDQTHDAWDRVLLDAGAAETCFSVLDMEGFWNRVQRFLRNRATIELSVEEAVSARLNLRRR
jgi:hypothetical protein